MVDEGTAYAGFKTKIGAGAHSHEMNITINKAGHGRHAIRFSFRTHEIADIVIGSDYEHHPDGDYYVVLFILPTYKDRIYFIGSDSDGYKLSRGYEASKSRYFSKTIEPGKVANIVGTYNFVFDHEYSAYYIKLDAPLKSSAIEQITK